MALWRDDRRYDDRRRHRDYDLMPFGFAPDVFGDIDREFRHMDRDFGRMERDLNRMAGGQLASLVDRSMPVLPNIILDEKGQRQAQFQFDTRGFNPDDIEIRTENGNKMVVTAKHEDKSEHHHHMRQFRRMVTLPEGANLDQMTSRLAPNGILTIQAPYNPPAIQQNQDRVLPITHGKTGQQTRT